MTRAKKYQCKVRVQPCVFDDFAELSCEPAGSRTSATCGTACGTAVQTLESTAIRAVGTKCSATLRQYDDIELADAVAGAW